MFSQSIGHLLFTLMPVELLLSTVAIAMVFVLVKRDMPSWIRFLLVPLFLYGTFYIGLFSINILGRPLPAYPDSEWQFIAYRTYVTSNHKQWIELWAADNSGESRLYIFPYSTQVGKELEKAKNMAKQGAVVHGKVKHPHGHEASADVWDVEPQILHPKPPPQRYRQPPT